MQNTNYEIIQGDTWTLDVYYEDKDGNPINISNYNIVAEVKDKQGGSILCASASIDDGVTLIDDGNYNAVRVEFSPSKTSKFNIPKSAYQIKIVETGDTLLMGWINVEPGVIDV